MTVMFCPQFDYRLTELSVHPSSSLHHIVTRLNPRDRPTPCTLKRTPMKKPSVNANAARGDSTAGVVPAQTRVDTTLCLGVGLLFVAAGLLKFLLPPGPGFQGGARGFGQMLATLNVPLPMVFGYLVPATEVLGGLGLITRRHKRLWTVPLIVDMVMAITLVGLPGTLGRPVRIGSVAIGDEPWRLPLEVGLLIALLWLWRPQFTD
jgi:uncharacterized membrane protein YphA (DoxX/SURF4 family)